MNGRYKFDFYIVFLFLIIALSSILIFPSIKSVRFAGGADEGYYFKYSSFVESNGISGFKALFAQYIRDKERWIYPAPIRVGYIFAASFCIKLFGSSFLSLAYLSFFSYLLSIIINYYFCSRFFGKEKALFFSLLVSFSPINMAMARRALSDSFATLLCVLSMWLFLDIMRKNKTIFERAVFVIIFALAVLAKETSVLLEAAFLAYMLVYNLKCGRGVRSADLFFLFACPLLIAGVTYFSLSGNPADIISMIKIMLRAHSTNRYDILYASGPWFAYIVEYMLLSPWTLLLSVGYVFYLVQNFNRIGLKYIYFLMLLLILFGLFDIFAKNIRYVMTLDVPIRLFSVLMLYNLTAVRKRNIRTVVIGAAVLSICVFDFITFNNMFIKEGIYDPVSIWLLGSRHFILLK